MKTLKYSLFAFFMLTLSLGCGGGQPDKEQLISDLKVVYQLLADENYEGAAEHFKGPDNVSKDKMAKQLTRILEINELSLEGIDILEEKGTFGKLAEVFPERGNRWAEKMSVSPDDCYALGYKGAEVAAVWSEGKFELIRLDDVGKLRRK